MKLRPEVRRFAERMERKLRRGDKEWGVDSWRSMYNEQIDERIDEELEEMRRSNTDQARANECADVANYLMFMSEKRRHLRKYR